MIDWMNVHYTCQILFVMDTYLVVVAVDDDDLTVIRFLYQRKPPVYTCSRCISWNCMHVQSDHMIMHDHLKRPPPFFFFALVKPSRLHVASIRIIKPKEILKSTSCQLSLSRDNGVV